MSNMHRKVKASDWLGDDSSSEEQVGDFGQTYLHDNQKGRLAFELQKSFGGDKRFKLDDE